MLVYHLSDDLMFSSRVTATARSMNAEAKTARSVDQLRNFLGSQAPDCVVLDLQNPGLALQDLMTSLPAPRPFLVAYGSHVHTAALNAAREAGCDLVLPRSKFVEELPKALPNWIHSR